MHILPSYCQLDNNNNTKKRETQEKCEEDKIETMEITEKNQTIITNNENK